MRLELLLIFFFSTSVQSQLLVTWNGTTITGPVLIYSDELPVDPSATTIGDPNEPGALICRSEDRARVSWHDVNGDIVRGPGHTTDIFKAIRTGEGVIPSLAQLLLNKVNTETNLNGLWHCQVNNIDEVVGIYSRGGGRGSISSNPQISLQHSSFGSSPPTFTLTGDTSGGPPTTYTWRRNGAVITANSSYSISIAVNGASVTVYQQSLYRSTLTVTGTLPGVYEYSVTNRATATTRTSSFTIEEGAPTTGLTAMLSGMNRVVVSWTGPLGPMYRVTADPGGFSMITLLSPQPITLQPGVYNISVMTISQHYFGRTAGPVQVTVRGTLPPVVITSSVTTTSITVSWTQPPFSYHPVNYTVTLAQIAQSSQEPSCFSDDNDRIPLTLTDTIIQITGLEEFSDYKVTITARFSESSIGVLSSEQFTTLSALPTGAPQNVTVTTTSRSVCVSWDAIECIERNGVITGYTVKFQELGGARIPEEVVNQIFTASGLTPHTNYTFRVAGVNNNGTGPFTDAIILQTDEDVPSIVSTLTAVLRFTSVVLTWSPPQHPNGVIIAYEVTYTVNDTNSTTINTTDISTTHIIELGLSTKVSGISVHAYTSVGPGSATLHADVATPQQPIPPIPLIVQTEPLSATSVNVSWQNVTVPGVVSYTIYYRPAKTVGGQSEQSVTVPSSESSVVIGGLVTDVDYQFQVAVTAELGGETFQGERSQSNLTILVTAHHDSPLTTTLSGITTTCIDTRDLSIAVVLTFLLTIILCAIMRLVEFVIHLACHSKGNQNDGGGDCGGGDDGGETRQEALYEDMDADFRNEKDVGETALNENEAYDPEASTEENIYATPDEI